MTFMGASLIMKPPTTLGKSVCDIVLGMKTAASSALGMPSTGSARDAQGHLAHQKIGVTGVPRS